MKRDVKALTKALRDANVTATQLTMASILLRERGLESALEFIDKIVKNKNKETELQYRTDHNVHFDESR